MGYVCNRGRNYCINPTASDQIGDQRCAGVCLDSYNAGTKVSLDYITSHDGSTNTLLLAEQVLANPPTTPQLIFDRSGVNSPGGSTAGDKPMWLNSCSVSTHGMEVEVGFEWGTFASPSSTPPGAPRLSDKLLSAHPGGGVNVAFCDGHQQYIQPSMDVDTFVHLMTPYDHDCGDSYTNPAWTNAPNYNHKNVLDEAKIY